MKSAVPSFEPTVIRASAGSGKTFALSNRFISLIAHGERPDRILATTFTKKAAGEILERVYQRLAAATLDPTVAKELGGHIGLPKFSSTDAGAVLERLVQSQARLNICTLDSFFVAIAQSFSFELGLTPGWGLADSDDDARIIRNSISQLCRNADPKELAELFYMLNRGDTRTRIHTQLEREISELFGAWRASSSSAWDWVQVPKGIDDSQFPEIIAAIGALKAPTTKKGETNSNWKNALLQAQSKAKAKDWEYFLESGLTGKILAGESTYYGHPILPEHQQAFAPLITHLRAYFLGWLRQQNQASSEFLSRFATEFEFERQNAQLFNFEGIKQALASAQVLGDLAELYYRLDSKIAHVLLDEFQDTSRAEWQVLEPVVAEILSKASTENSFFCVGDTKQAIYGWRGGVAEIFERLEDTFPLLRDYVQHRDESRRSAPAVIETVNSVFGRIAELPAGAEYKEIFAGWAKRFNPHTTAVQGSQGYVELRAVESTEDEDTAEALTSAAALQAKELLSTNPDLSIGILLRRNDSVKGLLEELWEQGVRASGEGGNPLTDSWHVCVLLSALRLIEHPADSIAGFLVGQSRLGPHLGLQSYFDTAGIERTGLELRKVISTQGLGETLREWSIALRGGAPAHDLQRMDQLVGLAHLYRPGRGKRLSDFVDWVESTPVENPAASQVRVMTVHKSKGLEFDAVILPELEDRIPRPQSDSLLVLRESPSAPPSYVSRYAERGVRNLEPRLQRMHEQVKAREVEEALAVLYVAMTRARFGLYMLVSSTPKNQLSFGTILRQALTGSETDSAILYKCGDTNFLKVGARKEPTEENHHPAAGSVRLAKSSRGRRRGMLKQILRNFDDGSSVDLAKHLKLHGDAISRVDAALLRLCTGIAWLDSADPPAGVFAEILGEAEANSGAADEAVGLILELIGKPEGKKIFVKTAPSCELYRSLPIAIRAEDGIVTGTIDRLIVEHEDGKPKRARAYQFLTESLSTERQRDLPQSPAVQACRKAAALFLGLELEAVETHVVLLRDGRVV